MTGPAWEFAAGHDGFDADCRCSECDPKHPWYAATPAQLEGALEDAEVACWSNDGVDKNYATKDDEGYWIFDATFRSDPYTSEELLAEFDLVEVVR